MKAQWFIGAAALIILTACQSMGGSELATSGLPTETPPPPPIPTDLDVTLADSATSTGTVVTIIPSATESEPLVATSTAETVASETRTPCNVLPRAELEAIIGPITSEPRYGNDFIEGIGELQSCNLDSEETLTFLWLYFTPPAYYSQRFSEIEPAQLETLDGLGEAAFWTVVDEQTIELFILNGDITITINLYAETLDQAREVAMQIAALTLAADPSYPLASGVYGAVDLCTTIPLEEIEAVVGKLGKMPFYSQQYDWVIGYMEGCYFEAAEGRNWVNFLYGPVKDAGSASEYYQNQLDGFTLFEPSKVEILDTEGYQAFWFDQFDGDGYISGELFVLRDEMAMDIFVNASDRESAIELAIQVAELAMRYIP